MSTSFMNKCIFIDRCELSIYLIGHRHNLFHSRLAAFKNRLIDNKFNLVNRLIAHSKAKEKTKWTWLMFENNIAHNNELRKSQHQTRAIFSSQLTFCKNMLRYGVWLRSRFRIIYQSFCSVKNRFVCRLNRIWKCWLNCINLVRMKYSNAVSVCRFDLSAAQFHRN